MERNNELNRFNLCFLVSARSGNIRRSLSWRNRGEVIRREISKSLIKSTYSDWLTNCHQLWTIFRRKDWWSSFTYRVWKWSPWWSFWSRTKALSEQLWRPTWQPWHLLWTQRKDDWLDDRSNINIQMWLEDILHGSSYHGSILQSKLWVSGQH